MGDKANYQHGGSSDGKSFGSKAPERDGPWGYGADNRDQPGTGSKPGEAQLPVFQPSVEKPS